MKIALSILLTFATLEAFTQSDFTGKWKLNGEKSTFNETPGTPAAARLIVEQDAGTITFQRNDRPKEKIKIDSPTALEIIEGENKTTVSMKTGMDKKELIETRTYISPETETADVAAKKTRTWRLSSDKKTLIIHDHIETTNGKIFDMTLVYARQ